MPMQDSFALALVSRVRREDQNVKGGGSNQPCAQSQGAAYEPTRGKEESSIQSVSSDCKANIDGGAKADDENVDLNVNKGDEAIGGLEKTKLNDPRLLEMMSGNKSHSSESATVCVNGEEDDGAHIPWACLQGVRGRWVFEVRWEQGTLWICPQGS
ncbi:hypothetical protein U1Q18_003292 [Sarracenia purpurea var. burkii]